MKSTLFGEIKVFIQLDLVDMKRLQKEMFDLDYVFFSLSTTNCSDDFSEINPSKCLPNRIMKATLTLHQINPIGG